MKYKKMTTLLFSILLSTYVFLGGTAYAQAVNLDEAVEILDIDNDNLIMFWAEESLTAYTVRYQISSNRGLKWSAATSLVNVPFSSDVVIEDFDGIFKLGTSGRLVATFAVRITSFGSALLVLLASDDFGTTWGSSAIIALNVANANFTGCPDLSTSYNETTGILSLTSTIVSGGTTNIYYSSSADSGVTWTGQMLSEVPTLCLDD